MSGEVEFHKAFDVHSVSMVHLLHSQAKDKKKVTSIPDSGWPETQQCCNGDV